jgi:hypothetical protein
MWNEKITIAVGHDDSRRNVYVLGWWDKTTRTARIEITVRDVSAHPDDAGLTISDEATLLTLPSREAAIRHLIALANATINQQRHDITAAERPHLGLSLVPIAFL